MAVRIFIIAPLPRLRLADHRDDLERGLGIWTVSWQIDLWLGVSGIASDHCFDNSPDTGYLEKCPMNMQKLFHPALGLLVLIVGMGAGYLISGTGLPGCNPPEGGKVQDAPARDAPKFWSDDAAAAAIESLGYDKAYLFRWNNGAIDGWVEFDGDDGPKRIPLDDTLRAARPDEKPGLLDPRRISGFVVVALRRQPAARVKAYEVRVEQGFKYDMGAAWDGAGSAQSAGYRGASHAGTVKDDDPKQPRTKSVVSTSLARLMRNVGEKSTPWLELRFVSSPD